MRRGLRVLALLALAALLGGCGAEVAEETTWLFAANVGKGDAIVLRVGDWTGLIDAGKPRAMGRVKAALERFGIDRLNGVFLTHTDSDHAGGLEWLAASDIPVDAWYAPALFTGVKAKKHPMALAAAARGQEVQWLRRGDSLSLGNGGAALRVLAPDSLFEDKDDNNSLVLLLESGQGRMLLTGDMELPEEAELLSFGDDLRCAVLKVPNHGDDDTTSEAFARAASAQIAVISTDGQEKPGTPDPGVVSRLQAAGSRVVVTEDCGLGALVTLDGGAASAEDVAFDAPPVDGLYIAGLDVEDDRITVANRSEAALSLKGCYLYSDRGDELYPFPPDAALAPGATLTVGTRSSDGDRDLLWEDKKVIHKKKSDTLTLYDGYGRALDSASNGL